MMIAGEASGDVHGAGVVRELKALRPGIEIFGIGGDMMMNAGMKLTYHIREMSFMGFAEVLKHLPLIRSVEKTLERLLELQKPDVVVLIDYPGFNLRFARIAKEHNIKVVYYISPQVWAWKKGRVKKMKNIIDKMLVVFPFEVPIYERENIHVEFVGHPLVEEMQGIMGREEFCKKFDLNKDEKFIAVIPGSRKQEIHNLFNIMLKASIELARSGGLAEDGKKVVVAVAGNLTLDEYLRYVPRGERVKFIQHATHEVMKHAEFAFVTSGTATLETACCGTPMVVVYKTSPVTYWIARMVVKIKNIALVNIVAEKTVVPELIQNDVTVSALVRAARAILTQPEVRSEMKKELQLVREKLGGVGASAKAAQAILTV